MRINTTRYSQSCNDTLADVQNIDVYDQKIDKVPILQFTKLQVKKLVWPEIPQSKT